MENTKYNKSEMTINKLEEIIRKYWKDIGIISKVESRGDKTIFFHDGPPFANGLPHWGHLLTSYIKDCFVRHFRMLGYKVSFKLGWDCHGLPAELAAEKDLNVFGKIDIERYGIDKFNDYCKKSVLKYTTEWLDYFDKCARWVDQGIQYKTMDHEYMQSVIWAFKKLYEEGLIVKSSRIMPYSWKCETPVSDFETRLDNSYRQKESKAVTLCFKLKNVIFDENKKIISKQHINDKLNSDASIFILAWTTTPWTLVSNLLLAINKNERYSIIKKNNNYYIIATALASKYTKDLGEIKVAEISGSDLIGIKYYPLFDYFSDDNESLLNKDRCNNNSYKNSNDNSEDNLSSSEIDKKNKFQILHGDFVTIDSGTGTVHVAPGFGEDDYILGMSVGVMPRCPLDSACKFVYPILDYIGQHVFDIEEDVIKLLKKHGLWIKTEQYLHNYPFCWRTDTPLIYREVPSWYLRVTQIREKLIKINKEINWIPEHIRDGLFGKWLENARDWSISRTRYWGCPIPVWESNDPQYPHVEVYGSIQEIADAFSIPYEEVKLHRPFIDQLTKTNPSDPTGKSKLVRVLEVFDCWFESGSMPYAQHGYPYSNKEKDNNLQHLKNWNNEQNADGSNTINVGCKLVVEYIAQTRGWFYTMLVLSSALFNKAPFENCICHGVILGDDGKKLSKRLQNYMNPIETFDKFGSDAVRLFMLSSQGIKGEDIVVEKDMDGVIENIRTVINPIRNATRFLKIYFEIDKADINLESILNNTKKTTFMLDRYIIAKGISSAKNIITYLDKYNTVGVIKELKFFLDILNNWYIRRSRRRFWKKEVDRSKIDAFNTLYTVLDIIAKVSAPVMPIISESIFLDISEMKNSKDFVDKDNTCESVHLTGYPNLKNELVSDYEKDTSVNEMEKVRVACNTVLHMRNLLSIPIKQPLNRVVFIGINSMQNDIEVQYDSEIVDIICDELNVLSYSNDYRSIIQDIDGKNAEEFNNIEDVNIEYFTEKKPKLNIPNIARDMPNAVQNIIRNFKNMKYQILNENQIEVESNILNLSKDHFFWEFFINEKMRNLYGDAIQLLPSNDIVVILDTKIDDKLMNAGRARNFVHAIQMHRKNQNCDILEIVFIVIYVKNDDIDIAHKFLNENRNKFEDIMGKILVLLDDLSFDGDKSIFEYKTISEIELNISSFPCEVIKCEMRRM